MKLQLILVLAIVLVAQSDTLGVIYDFGGEYNIDFHIDDHVGVYDSPSGDITTVNLLPGGVISDGHRLSAWNNSYVNVCGGWTDFLKASDSSYVNVSAGTVDTDLLADDDSVVTISGGLIVKQNHNLLASRNSQVTISGGSVRGNIDAAVSSQVTISGGSINGKIKVRQNAKVTISGGSIGGILDAYDNSVVTIYGSVFNYPFGEITNSTGILTGTLANGDLIDNQFFVSGDARIVLIPSTENLAGYHASWSSNSVLYLDDFRTGEQVAVGPTGVADIGALELSPDGMLYAIQQEGRDLYKLDLTTGIGTLINHSIMPSNGVCSLAFAPDGKLYAAQAGELYKVDIVAGSATLVGSMAPCVSPRALAIDDSGRGICFDSGAKWLYEVDVNTATTRSIGELYQVEFDAFDYGPDGVLYGWNELTLYKVDLDALAITEVQHFLHGIGEAFTVNPTAILPIHNVTQDTYHETIQAAIDDANDYDTIEVPVGTYYENINFKSKNITVRGTDPNDPNVIAITIINGSQAADPNFGATVTFAGSEDPNCVLTGFTITGGTGNYLEGWTDFWSYWGGGICIEPNASPTITRNIVTGNISNVQAGANIWCGRDTQPRITHNIIEDGNALYGAGIHCENAYGTLSEGPFIAHNIIRNNTAGYGAGVACGNTANAIIHNNLIYGNQADAEGGAIYLFKNGTSIISNTIVNNTAPDGAAISCHKENYSTISNNIIAFNNGGPALSTFNETDHPIATYNDFYDNEGGDFGGAIDSNDPAWVGNIFLNPLFANDGDYHLKSQAGRWDPNTSTWVVDSNTSPCIDRGDPMSPIGYEPFPNGGIINMGAYGGTSEASKSYFGKPPCEIIVAGDVNGDCVVNFLDFRLMALHWCEDNNP